MQDGNQNFSLKGMKKGQVNSEDLPVVSHRSSEASSTLKNPLSRGIASITIIAS